MHHPARWAGLGKLLGLRPEIPENERRSSVCGPKTAASACGSTVGTVSPPRGQLLEISAGTIVRILRQSLANAIAVHIRFLRQKNDDRPASQAFVSMLQVARPRPRIDGIDCVANCLTLPAYAAAQEDSGRHMECACYFD